MQPNISNDSMSTFGVGSERLLTMIPNSCPRLSLQEYTEIVLCISMYSLLLFSVVYRLWHSISGTLAYHKRFN